LWIAEAGSGVPFSRKSYLTSGYVWAHPNIHNERVRNISRSHEYISRLIKIVVSQARVCV